MTRLLIGFGITALVAGAAATTGIAAGTGTSAKTVVLTIPHVAHGCHVWSDGTHQTSSMGVRMRRGDRLVVVNRDIDMHRLMQTAGPRRMALGGPMMMNDRRTMVFSKAGVYRFTTRVTEMHMGALPSVSDHGRKNILKLAVTVR
jgi:hypothetical protein